MEGSIGQDKKLASNQEVLGSTNLGVPMCCYIMLHDLRWLQEHMWQGATPQTEVLQKNSPKN
jgi:hypothetical protein